MGVYMDYKTGQAIKAGIIGGIILAFFVFLNIGTDIISTNVNEVVGIFGCCIFLAEIIIMVGLGALAAHYAATELRSLRDGAFVGGIAGLIAGIIMSIAEAIGAFLQPLVNPAMLDKIPGIGSEVISVLAGGMAIICCAPVIVIICIVLGAVGGAIYASLKLHL